MAHCPECESLVEIEVDDVEEGQIVTCPECGVDLEVVNTNPIELDLAEDEDLEEEDEEVHEEGEEEAEE